MPFSICSLRTKNVNLCVVGDAPLYIGKQQHAYWKHTPLPGVNYPDLSASIILNGAGG